MLWFSNSYYVVYIICSIPTIYLFNYRLDYNLYVCSIFNMLGGIGRYFGGANYTIAIISTFLVSIAQLWVLPSPAMISEIW